MEAGVLQCMYVHSGHLIGLSLSGRAFHHRISDSLLRIWNPDTAEFTTVVDSKGESEKGGSSCSR